ncbi:unnamed protein product [Colias eurytheme]|nr:unnamed protein product [Colias eurytheme]
MNKKEGCLLLLSSMLQRLFTLAKSVSGISKALGNAMATNYSIAHDTLNSAKLLQVQLPIINPVCTLKVKGRVQRRCRSCYLVYRQERLYNMCKEHPRHKQVLRAPKPHNTWILTHASQSKVRPW